MNIDIMLTTLTTLTTLGVVVERITQVTKPIYMKVKNNMFKTDGKELEPIEKECISIIVGIGLCLISNTGIQLSNVNQYIQCILAGVISSLGSNILHSVISMLQIIKTNMDSKSEG